MADPATIALLIGLGTLLIERAFSIFQRVKSSKCGTCCDVEFNNSVVDVAEQQPAGK